MNRWPALVIIIAMIGGLIALDQRSTTAPLVDELRDVGLGPASAAPDSSGSTWYCAAGFTTPDGVNDHVIVITNPTDEPATGTLTIYPSLLDTLGDPVTFDLTVQPLEVPAGAQQTVSLAPIVASLNPALATNTGAFVGALAEFDGAGVNVEHRIFGAGGSDIGPCATSASTSWWFASGTTTAEVGYQLYLLNPFPEDAVVDISFITDAGTRKPNAFKSKLVPAESLTVLRVTEEVPVNAQMTAQITVTRGRLVAERIQLFENVGGPLGLSLSLGSNRLAEQWFFPAGRSIPGVGESYLIYNPGDTPAEVEFELKPDSADRLGDVAPLKVPVGSRERWIVTVTGHPTHPSDALATLDASTIVEPSDSFFASVRSFNGVPIVVERILTRPAEAGGVTASLGIDVASTDQSMAIPAALDDAGAATLAILNPAGATISRVEIFVGGPEGEEARAEVELAPRRRAVYDLMTLVEPGDQWIRVVSSTGTVAEVTIATNRVLLSTAAIPVQGTTSVPDLFAFD